MEVAMRGPFFKGYQQGVQMRGIWSIGILRMDRRMYKVSKLNGWRGITFGHWRFFIVKMPKLKKPKFQTFKVDKVKNIEAGECHRVDCINHHRLSKNMCQLTTHAFIQCGYDKNYIGGNIGNVW